MSLPDAYPLQWPGGWSRTSSHKRSYSDYKVGETRARDEMYAAIRRLGGKVPLVSSNMRVRLDGMPYAKQLVPEDPGVAVYWVRQGKQEVMACDRWLRPWENMRAIYHAIEGLRSMERAGATQIMERAFQAFQLPETTTKSWRNILGIESGMTPSEAYIRRIAREKMVKLHPDKPGGSDEAFKDVEAALREALKELRC